MGLFDGIGGAILGGVADMAFNAWSAEKSRDYDKHMYRHRYQYAVQDLQKAGLNPMLAYGHGPGSVPGGAQAQSGGAMSSAARTAAEYRLQKLQEENIQSQTDANRADAEKKRAEAAKTAGVDTELSKRMAEELIARTKLHGVNARESAARTAVAEHQLPLIIEQIWKTQADTKAAEATAVLKGMEAEKIRALLPWLERLTRAQSFGEELSLPEKMNFAYKAQTWFGKAMPFIRDVTGAVGDVGGIHGSFKIPFKRR